MTDSPRHQLGEHLRHGNFDEHECSCGVTDREWASMVYGDDIGFKYGTWLGFIVGVIAGALAIGMIG